VTENSLLTSRRSAPAAQRNRGPILDVLQRILPASGLVLEIASGTGEHAVHFAAALPELEWQPSDAAPQARASVAAWRIQAALPNLRAPLDLDVSRTPWPIAAADAVVCINMLHIAPWAAAQALMAGAARILGAGGVLYLYGPYRRNGAHTAESNEVFDRQLKSSNAQWGVRDLEAVADFAAQEALSIDEVVVMPANNFSVVFRKRANGG
jgi:SAM-dependent methyltransferase